VRKDFDGRDRMKYEDNITAFALTNWGKSQKN
jgi:hypothetical protein